MESLKVIFEKVWSVYEVLDPGKGQMQYLSLKREKRRIREIKDRSAFQEKNTEEAIKSFGRRKKKPKPKPKQPKKAMMKQMATFIKYADNTTLGSFRLVAKKKISKNLII